MMLSDAQLLALATQVGARLQAQQQRLVTAESCTGGWVAKVLTDVAGSSAWYAGGAVVYSNALKHHLLGVSHAILAEHGAVSAATVTALAEGALPRLGGDVSLAISGIAGPGGGTVQKPVGTVWLAWAWQSPAGSVRCRTHGAQFAGDREAVRRQAVAQALAGLLETD